MQNPKFTLIIPHYNNMRLLNRLLTTVPKRDDLEVIVVDDCSPEGEGELSALEVDYPNLRVYTTGENGGGGKARNIGLRKAHGEYILFADADDYFTPGMGEILDFCGNSEKKYDLVFFSAQSVDTDTYAPSYRANQLNSYIKKNVSNPEEAQLYLRYLFGEPWCKIIRKDIIDNNKIGFDEIPVHNDTFFSYMCGFHAKNIGVCPIVGYCVTERAGSISKKTMKNKALIRTEVFAKKNYFLKKNNIPIFDELLLTPFISTFGASGEVRNELFNIAAKYEISKGSIYRHIFSYYLKRIRNKISRLLRKG